MTYAVDFEKYAPQAAMVIISGGVIPSEGIASTLGAMALSTIGIFGAEIASRQLDWILHKWSYKIAPRHEYTTYQPFEQAFFQAFERMMRIKSGTKSYQWFKKDEYLRTNAEAMYFLKDSILDGTCRGEADFLLEKASNKEKPLSFEESLRNMDTEEIIFKQLLHRLWHHACKREETLDVFLDNKRAKYNKKQKRARRAACTLSDKQMYVFREKRIAKINRELSSNSPLFISHEGPDFKANESSFSYQSHLEQFAKTLRISGEDAMGIVSLPDHVVAFQLSSKGYFIYDPKHKGAGLFKYPDKQAFFEGMRLLVLADLEKKDSLIAFELIS